MIKTITPTGAERADDALAAETVEHAARALRRDGALLLRDVVDRTLIAEARAALLAKYARFMDGEKRGDAVEVGGRRQMIAVDFEPPFDDPALFANPWLLPILAAALDEEFVIGAFGAVCSAAEAPVQHRHRDGALLFPRAGIDGLLPATAITVGIPLVEMNEHHGTTTLWLGSHRDAKGGSDDNGIEPVVPQGSAILWDFRLKHSGTANRSDTVRPLLYLTYCRPWWLDHRNFTQGDVTPLPASRQSLDKLSAEHRRLLARAEAF